MKFIEILNEVYENTFKTFYGTTEVYKNPTSKDFKDLGKKEVRFIVSSDGKRLYVFDVEVMHVGIAGALGINYHDVINNIYGEGSIENNKINFLNTNILGMYNMKTIKAKTLAIDWSWADKYFTEPLKNSIKELYK